MEAVSRLMISLLILSVTSVQSAMPSQNGAVPMTRCNKYNRRYSGSKLQSLSWRQEGVSPDVKCLKVGMFGHPTDCMRFYRCDDTGGYMSIFWFVCPTGTVFDQQLLVCNFASNVADPRCRGNQPNSPTTVVSMTTPTSTQASIKPCDVNVANSTATVASTTPTTTAASTLDMTQSTTMQTTTTTSATTASATPATSTGASDIPAATTNPTASFATTTAATTTTLACNTNATSASNATGVSTTPTVAETTPATAPSATPSLTETTTLPFNTNSTSESSNGISTLTSSSTAQPTISVTWQQTTAPTTTTSTTWSSTSKEPIAPPCTATESTTKDMTTMPTFSLFCGDMQIHRHPLRCDLFYACAWRGLEAVVTTRSCLDGMIFDESIQSCKIPDPGAACDPVSRVVSTHGGFDHVRFTNQSPSLICLWSDLVRATRPASDRAVLHCGGQPSFYRHPLECDHTYRCFWDATESAIQFSVLSCPFGHGFDESTTSCKPLLDPMNCKRRIHQKTATSAAL